MDLLKDRHDWHQHFDWIVSNPPYVTPSEWETLMPDVQAWEDRDALVGLDADGMGFYGVLLTRAQQWLRPSPHAGLVVEVGEKQAEHVVRLFSKVFSSVDVWKDSRGVQRVVQANSITPPFLLYSQPFLTSSTMQKAQTHYSVSYPEEKRPRHLPT
jgi:methylase of polypeptide subunit release factors